MLRPLIPVSRATKIVLGIAFFIPLDLSFSCWFFFVMRKLFQVLGRVQGWDAASAQGFPYFGEQAAGAWITRPMLMPRQGCGPICRTRRRTPAMRRATAMFRLKTLPDHNPPTR